MKLLPAITLLILFLSACAMEEKDKTSILFNGDYRFHAGIGEFFNCEDRVKYYVAKNRIAKELEERYLALGLKAKDDVFVQVEGYFQEEKPEIDGVNPITVFVPTRFIGLDKNRGCDIRGRRAG